MRVAWFVVAAAAGAAVIGVVGVSPPLRWFVAVGLVIGGEVEPGDGQVKDVRFPPIPERSEEPLFRPYVVS